jgi:PP-loop superfamily ATP-utilizing enzyme/Fe-S cluster biogenesis protein NfuA
MPFDEQFINLNGECVICHEHRKKWLNKNYIESAQELESIFDHYKGRNKNKKYDAIVSFSGGKDSAYALYLVKKKFGLRPLAVTGDNGFFTQRALKNQKIIVERLGVDHLFLSRDEGELKELYRVYFRKTKNFCEICYLTILNALGQAALEYDVPLIITGTAFKVDSSHFRSKLRYCFEDAFEIIVKDKIPVEVYSKYLTKEIRAKKHFHLLHLFDYVNHVENEMYELLENELEWGNNIRDDHHSDCRFHHMLGYIKMLKNDLASLVFMKPAALLRDGQITVGQFNEMIKNEREVFQKVDRKQFDEFLDYFGIDEDFLSKKLDSPRLANPVIQEKDFDQLIKAKLQSGNSESDLIDMLIEIIRPEIKRDGGDIQIIEYDNQILKIALLGGCRGCMIADQVMVRYLEYLMRKYISDDIIIENVKELAP